MNLFSLVVLRKGEVAARLQRHSALSASLPASFSLIFLSVMPPSVDACILPWEEPLLTYLLLGLNLTEDFTCKILSFLIPCLIFIVD